MNGTEDKPLESDRPDFTEASSVVGLRRVQIESGYTFIRDSGDGQRTTAHSFPETLLRVGMFAEWFEARVGWNYGVHANLVESISSTFSGSDDLYLVLCQTLIFG